MIPAGNPQPIFSKALHEAKLSETAVNSLPRSSVWHIRSPKSIHLPLCLSFPLFFPFIFLSAFLSSSIYLHYTYVFPCHSTLPAFVFLQISLKWWQARVSGAKWTVADYVWAQYCFQLQQNSFLEPRVWAATNPPRAQASSQTCTEPCCLFFQAGQQDLI